jgi:two-component system, OmpR family, response regulator MtrA
VAGRPPEAGPAASGPVPAGLAPDGARPASVLLAEHEPEVAEMSARFLRRDGLLVRLVTSPEQTLAELTGGPDAAAVVDLTMPGLDLRRIRRVVRTPVVFLAADLGGSRPRGLAAKGDAAASRRWLGRPFSPRQLVGAVRDVLAETGSPRTGPPRTGLPRTGPPRTGLPRTGPARPGPAGTASAGTASARAGQAGATGRAPAPPGQRSAGQLRLDSTSRAVIAGGYLVPLTATEYALLAFMLEHPGRVLSRRRLLGAAGRPTAGDRAADVHIAQLRAKIGADPRTGVIRTVPRAGYVLDP